MALEISGKLHELFDMQAVTERFNKREFVLEVPGKNPQLVLFQLTGKRCSALDEFAVGDQVRVEFTLRGRKWTSRQGEVRYYNSLEVTRLERLESAPGAPPADTDDDEPPF